MSSYSRTRRSTATSETSTLSIAGLICAIVGFFVLSIVLGPVAMILGWLGMGRRWRTKGRGIAVAAFVIGAVDTILAVVWLTTAAGTGVLY